jgi:hypothetical protein
LSIVVSTQRLKCLEQQRLSRLYHSLDRSFHDTAPVR